MFCVILKIFLCIFFRDEDSKERNSNLEKTNGNSHDVDTKSDGSMSDSTVARSLGSSATKDFRLISNPGEPGSRVRLYFPLIIIRATY